MKLGDRFTQKDFVAEVVYEVVGFTESGAVIAKVVKGEKPEPAKVENEPVAEEKKEVKKAPSKKTTPKRK